ncbi:hypothetical protein [Nonomuraea angiospora]|uniref:hypothetical protein n=1 Tax=Nonomuraea angiospora TaxID=46172 RepID=UPI0029B0864F|nr:hypothetical protein [Nonomuraea angiospora]MDX3103326.1 hypothetical protein [Nonomuraea angiospora]
MSALPHQPLDDARQLAAALAAHGIGSDVHHDCGMPMVSVWVGLIVWCEQGMYWWRTGWNPHRQRAIYAWHTAAEPTRAARRVALRYAELRTSHPLSPLIDGAQPCP